MNDDAGLRAFIAACDWWHTAIIRLNPAAAVDVRASIIDHKQEAERLLASLDRPDPPSPDYIIITSPPS